MPEDMGDEGMDKGMDTITHHTFRHPSKIMFRVILNQLEAKAEELLAEDQAGFRPGRSTVEQIFNSLVITEKHLQHQRNLFNNFIAPESCVTEPCM